MTYLSVTFRGFPPPDDMRQQSTQDLWTIHQPSHADMHSYIKLNEPMSPPEAKKLCEKLIAKSYPDWTITILAIDIHPDIINP
ncbi:MAG: hypothetical protein ACTJG2_02060 [Candidatus Saccharimonadales bacterium]